MKRLTSLFLSLLLFSALSAQTEEKLLIENITVIPTHINQSFPNKDVVIHEGKIELIRDHLEKDTVVYSQGKVDGTDKFLIPSLVDAHAHFPEQENIETYFLMNLMNGVSTLRSMRGEEWHLTIDQDAKFTPNLLLASPAFRRNDSISNEERDAKMAKYKKDGYDFVKILSLPDVASFSALVESSKKHDIMLAGHCSKPIDFSDAISSGRYESIEHLHGIAYLRDFEDIKNAIDVSILEDIYYCPTTDWYVFSPKELDGLRKRKGQQFISEKKKKEWEESISSKFDKLTAEEIENVNKRRQLNYDYRIRLMRFLYKQGLPMLAGADLTGVYGVPGFGYINELKHFEKAGLSLPDILKTACYNTAEMRGEELEWGTIRTGSNADLVILNKNPLKSLENLRTVDAIVLRGSYLTKEALEAELKKKPKLK